MQHRTTQRIPSYRLHKPSGLAVVRLNGKDVYLGKHGTPESQAEYRRVIAEWLASPTPSLSIACYQDRSTINELVLAYLQYAKSYYTKNGRATGELANMKDAVKPLVLLHGHVEVSEFTPRSLKAVRDEMIRADLSRKVINARINRIRRVFKWGVENEIVTASVLHGLQAVAPLKRGRCEAREVAPVAPVPYEQVEAVLRVAPPQLCAMIRLQLLTGMRPGEVVRMRGCDIERSQAAWSYAPLEHKTEHHGRSRIIYMGPQAQAVLIPYLSVDDEAFIFSPRDVAAYRSRERRAARITPLTPSQRNRSPKTDPQKQPGSCYTTRTYARAILYACDRAMPHFLLSEQKYSELTQEQQFEVDSWRKQHRWSPNQLRHNAATHLRKQFGIEAARVILGHSSAGITEIYAEQDLAKAAEIMAKVG